MFIFFYSELPIIGSTGNLKNTMFDERHGKNEIIIMIISLVISCIINISRY
ncbi:MAG: hypothetical protein C5S40_04605 [ANME-2 cluster archaeon]|nr:hypothetical protein [ANME-2 cluster archaeon]